MSTVIRRVWVVVEADILPKPDRSFVIDFLKYASLIFVTCAFLGTFLRNPFVRSEYGDWTLFSIAILAWVILAGAVALVLRAMYVLYTGVSGLSMEPFDKNSGTPSKTEAKLWV